MVSGIFLFSVLFHWKTAGHDPPDYFHDLLMGCDCNLKNTFLYVVETVRKSISFPAPSWYLELKAWCWHCQRNPEWCNCSNLYVILEMLSKILKGGGEGDRGKSYKSHCILNTLYMSQLKYGKMQSDYLWCLTEFTKEKIVTRKKRICLLV